MIMLDATDGAFVYDCHGRRIQNVISCNPMTDDRWASPLHWYFSKIVYRWPYRDTLPRRHGFWPAPLTLQSKTCYADTRDR